MQAFFILTKEKLMNIPSFPHGSCDQRYYADEPCLIESIWNRFAGMVNAMDAFTVETVLIIAAVYVAIMVGYTAGVVVWRLSQRLQERAIAISAHNAMHAAVRRQRLARRS